MNTTTKDALYAFADDAAHDPAFVAEFKSYLIKTGLWERMGCPAPVVKKAGPPPAFPAPDDITCVQTAIFDNWPRGVPVKGFPSRYGYALEVWTQAAADIIVTKGKKPNFLAKSQGALMDATNLRRQIKVLRKPRLTPIDIDYLDALDELADAVEEGGNLVALLNTSIADDRSSYERGTYYHAHQFLIVKMVGVEVESATLVLDQNFGSIGLAPFSDRDAGGNPHPSNVILQSRHDASGMSTKSWATNEK